MAVEVASGFEFGGCLHEIFEKRTREHPGQIAVVDGSRAITYAALNDAADNLACKLRERGVGPETLVGLCARRSAELVCGVLAILKAGGGYVPLDPDYPSHRLKFIVADAGCPLMLIQGGLKSIISEDPENLVEMASIEEMIAWKTAAITDALPVSRPSPENVAYVIYTSGSTGAPKGVVVPHRQVTRLFAAVQSVYDIGASDTWSLFHSFAFDFSVWEMWGALLFGGRLVIVSYSISRTPELFLQLLAEQRVTILNQTPSAFRQLTAAVAASSYPYTALRLVVFGGEELDPAALAPWFSGYGLQCPRLFNMYGITETTVHVTISEMRPHDVGAGRRPIGRPLPDLQVHILDEYMSAVPVGTAGEMYIGGEGVARGYLNRPELTAARFVPDPFGPPGSRLYRTGDLAILTPTGELEFRGRADLQVQLRGFRIELGEIESAVNELPRVEACAAVLQGSGDDARLVVFIVGDLGPVSEVRERLADRLPWYMLPSRIARIEALPMTPNGKTDRKTLSEETLERHLGSAPYSPPRTLTEERLTVIWSEVLDISPIGRSHEFAMLGGTSLQAIRILDRIRQEFGFALPIIEFFRAGTVSSLARVVAEVPQGPVADFPLHFQFSRRLARLPLGQVIPSAGQERLYFLAALGEECSIAYNVPAAVRVSGLLDTKALSLAINDLIGRHEVLQMEFRSTRAGISAQVAASAILGLEVLEFIDVATEELPEDAALRAAEAAAALHFDLAEAPLLRATLYRLAPDEYMLALVVHHIVIDGLSLALLGDDLAECYRARVNGQQPAPRIACSYAAFVQAQREREVSGAFQAGTKHWRDALAGAPTKIALPRSAHDVTATASFRGTRLSRTVPREARAALSRLAMSTGVTVHAVLLASLAICLGQITGQQDMIIGSPAAGRPSSEFEDVVGFFVNMLPVRIRLEGTPSFVDAIHRAHEAQLNALDHQYVPFEKIVAALASDRGADVRPVVQVVLTQQNWCFHPRLARARTRPVSLHNGSSKFDLVIDAVAEEDALTLIAEFDTSLLTAEVVHRVLEGMIETLSHGLDDPHAPVSLP
jgi:amino acid adenylation domain-containing protein